MVSRIWTTLISFLVVWFRLETIFAMTPAASKDYILTSKVVKNRSLVKLVKVHSQITL